MTPIRDYALIGNCETAALIGPQGDIDWLCLPAFDAGSFFGRLLDNEKGGSFCLAPTKLGRVERKYADDSAILETRFLTERGVVRLTDFFVIARDPKALFCDFTSLHPTSWLVRLVEVEGGDGIEMEMKISARPDYARKRPDWRARGTGAFETEKAALFSNAPLRAEGDDLLGQFVVRPGERFFAVLDYNDGARRMPNEKTVDQWLRVTEAFWREWNFFNHYRGPHSALVRRSAVTLKLLTYAQSGGFVAAPTTSLPERRGGDANWDYRFCWLRDTALFTQALFGLGYSGEAQAFLDFTMKQWEEKFAEDGADPNAATLEVMYPVCDAPIAPETELGHLAGYANSQPVRFGNRAQDQFQLDNYGHLFQSLFFFQHSGGRIEDGNRRMLTRLTSEVIRLWREADNGLWEEKDKSQFTYGKIMCWAALERARALLGDDDGKLEKVCAEIRTEVERRGLTNTNDGQVFSAKFDEGSLDASSLLAFTTGFCDEDLAERTRAALERGLAHEPLIYRNEKMAGQEGAFLLCSYWWINHLIREGQLARAEDLLERVIKLASPLGLFSEEIDPATGEFLGNFPQAFSHLGLVQSLLNLQSAQKKRGFYALADHEKFTSSVGATIGWRGVLAGFWRVPRTALLIFSTRSKWRAR